MTKELTRIETVFTIDEALNTAFWNCVGGLGILAAYNRMYEMTHDRKVAKKMKEREGANKKHFLKEAA